MKSYISLSSLLFLIGSVTSIAQSTIHNNMAVDTIYANDTKNVALFFPQPIRQGITGADHFVFTFNRETENYLGLLQAKPGKESNLLVINKNGSIFSYIVRYKKHLSQFNYFIPMSNSIGNEKPEELNLKVSDSVTSKPNNRDYYYQRFCDYLLDRRQKLGKINKQYQGIELSVENIVFDTEELYFVIQIENKSSLDFDVNFLKLSVETRQKGKQKSLQRLYFEPIYKQQMPLKITKNETTKLVYVLPKFSLSNDRRAVLELNEKHGERNIELKISHRFINHPN
ncbi:DUF4138 domain-containing protein [Formosa sediminum]|uniref:DUF4138 domain-containing protein n=1 Tax=Formosa sediminum TaxID=2594004 RepID=A0A516GUS5_9FLAO|nr:DUF4138 domain-containing protein [Formosa sediminum]QDO95272.1 DUF4138 domain-containing protein [Formosa sediminum]